MTGRTFTLREAAEACGVSLSTIRRKRESGAFRAAYKDGSGWRIPLSDLLGAGLTVNAPAPPDEQPVSEVGEVSEGELAQALADLDQERKRRLEVEQEAAVLRATVAAQRENLSDLRTAMRMLTAGTTSDPELPHDLAQSEVTEHPMSDPELPHERPPDVPRQSRVRRLFSRRNSGAS